MTKYLFRGLTLLMAVCLLAGGAADAFAQQKKKKGKGKSQVRTSTRGALPQKDYAKEVAAIKKKKKNKKGKVHIASNDFVEQRKKENFKAEQKMADSPQYTDKMYFGHKRPPKKRPLGKRKFCKECGMKH
jgi:hypothetical protein